MCVSDRASEREGERAREIERTSERERLSKRERDGSGEFYFFGCGHAHRGLGAERSNVCKQYAQAICAR